ncbi:unnamed protein product [Mytilus edulis]|uniref:Vitelline envelope sperm lysin receptor C-terminal domain-containing protein n=1 Tax=Mytilus edulis TaxID=6550 RepID=A0A8S3UIT3_MYTED|nr:unnamed protein product [Mytilus edulis]
MNSLYWSTIKAGRNLLDHTTQKVIKRSTSTVAVRSTVPKGYILDVSQFCGEVSGSADFSGRNANVTIKSDLYVQAQIKCRQGLVTLNPINETNTETTLSLCYTNDTSSGCPCEFNTPSNKSNFYSAELQVFWGFNNGTLMNEYETYTISCIAEGNGTEKVAVKDIDEDYLPVNHELVKSLGGDYAGSATLKLIDILGEEIDTASVPMSKKVELCGDGTIIPKNKGFTTKTIAGGNEKTATSPFFKIFKLLETTKQGGISYECSFTVCNDTCDGSSCAMRNKRSVDSLAEIEEQEKVKTPLYHIQRLEDRVEDRLDQSRQELSDLKMDTRLKIASLEIVGIGAVALLSLVIATYSCIRVEQKRQREKVSAKMSSA